MAVIPQKDILITNDWMTLLKWINSEKAELVDYVEVEGLTQKKYPAYRAAGGDSNSQLVAYIR